MAAVRGSSLNKRSSSSSCARASSILGFRRITAGILAGVRRAGCTGARGTAVSGGGAAGTCGTVSSKAPPPRWPPPNTSIAAPAPARTTTAPTMTGTRERCFGRAAATGGGPWSAAADRETRSLVRSSASPRVTGSGIPELPRVSPVTPATSDANLAADRYRSTGLRVSAASSVACRPGGKRRSGRAAASLSGSSVSRWIIVSCTVLAAKGSFPVTILKSTSASE